MPEEVIERIDENDEAIDVDTRVAFIVTWPSSDSPIGAANIVAAIVKEALDEQSAADLGFSLEVSSYRTGPAASGLFFSLLFTVYRDVRPTLNDGASLIAWGGFAISLVRKLRLRLRRSITELPGNDVQRSARSLENLLPILSQPMIIGLCYQHFCTTYSKTAHSIDWFDRSKFRSYSSAKHPGGDQTYTVRILVGKHTGYVYVVDSVGRAIEHFIIDHGEMSGLPVPTWFDSEGSGYGGFSETVTTKLFARSRQRKKR